MNSISEILKQRKSCRKFKDQVPSKETLNELINDAVWVPSGSNMQPWRFAVISNKEKLKSYSDKAKKMWLENLDECPYMKAYESTFTNPEANIFYNAPSLIVVYGDSESFWFNYDCSMVALNIHILAEERKMGCCWIGEAHNILAVPSVKQELGIPENYTLVAPIIIGYPDADREGKQNPNKRKPFKINFF